MTSGEARTAREQWNMMSALGCAHQLPRTGFPAMASARLGTTPRADSSTIPFLFTKASACFGVMTSMPSLSAQLNRAQPCPPDDIAPGMNDAPVNGKAAQRGRRVRVDARFGGERRSALLIRGHAKI